MSRIFAIAAKSKGEWYLGEVAVFEWGGGWNEAGVGVLTRVGVLAAGRGAWCGQMQRRTVAARRRGRWWQMLQVCLGQREEWEPNCTGPPVRLSLAQRMDRLLS